MQRQQLFFGIGIDIKGDTIHLRLERRRVLYPSTPIPNLTMIHLIKNINNDRTVCGIDTIKVANSNDSLTLLPTKVTCQKCKNLVK